VTVFCAGLVMIGGCGKPAQVDKPAPPGGKLEAPPLNLVSDCKIVLGEAEDAVEVVKPMRIGQEAGKSKDEAQTASKGKYLEIPKGAGKGKDVGGKAVIKFNIDQPGEYVFWARVFFLGGCWNSFGIEVDGYKIKMKRTDEKSKKEEEVLAPPEISNNSYEHWQWVSLIGPNQKPIRFDLKKGEHMLIVHNAEDGVKMDQYLLTSEPDPDKWYPAGIMTE
jgi:hypothetical protein